MNTIASSAPSQVRDYRLDVLRGVAVILVILRHLQPWSGFAAASPYAWVFYKQVTLLGVPIFYLVSLYLFSQRVDRGVRYLGRRLLRIFSLYLIFAACQVAIYMAVHHTRPRGIGMVYDGGPALPIVGQSVFYFFFDLMILIVVMWLFMQLPPQARVIVGVGIVVASAGFFEAASVGLVEQVLHYNPLSFIVYVPLAAWLASGRCPVARLWPWLAVAYVALVVQNMVLTGPYSFSLGVVSDSLYARLSILVGSFAVVTATLATTPRPVPGIDLAGRYSLGLFALHKWAWYVVAVVLAGLSVPAREQVMPIVIAVCAILLTCLAVWLLASSPLRPLVIEARWRRPKASADEPAPSATVADPGATASPPGPPT